MSYGAAAALQAAIYQHLAADSTLQGLVGSNIYDDVPPGPLPGTYVSLGIEDVRDRSDKTGRGALHILTVSVVSDAAGFQVAKTVAAAGERCAFGRAARPRAGGARLSRFRTRPGKARGGLGQAAHRSSLPRPRG